MKLSMSKTLCITSAAVCCLSAGILLAQQQVELTTDLGNTVQHITSGVIFAIPTQNGGWQATGKVQVSAKNNKLKVEGSFVSNTDKNNDLSDTGSSYASLL
jgi:hypothetical protein